MKKSLDPFWIIGGLTLLAWVVCFWVFLTREAPLASDAVSFYDHLKFYVDNISRGVYPFWDPLWDCGSPNEFFLRRIGPFNPFLFLLVIPYKLGVNYWVLFASFVTFYFFLGTIGFYKLALEVLKDKNTALLAFVLLAMSSLGTRVFDSYIMMLMTPMVWFFYFLLVFGRTMKKYAFVGMVFCVMLLMTTYIPFYFIVIALTFMIFFIPVFPVESKKFIMNVVAFIHRNPALVAVCLFAAAVSCIPGFMFFKQAGEGTFAMPLRHFNAAATNILSVESDVTTYWAIPEEFLFSSFYLEDLRWFGFAIFYVPLSTIIFLLLGIFAPLNRKFVFMFIWVFFLFLVGSPYYVPFYKFLHQHVFFFKYFRNLHFFLWLVILPLLILMAVEQLRLFLQTMNSHQYRKLAIYFVMTIHALLGVFLIWGDIGNYSTWMVGILSFFGCLAILLGRISLRTFYMFCCVVAMIQPFEAYHHLSRNVPKYLALSPYGQFSTKFQYTRAQKTILSIDQKDLTHETTTRNNPLYFGTRWYNLLWDNIDFLELKNYTFAKFVLYDRVSSFDEQKQNIGILEETWKNNLNVAYVDPSQIDAPLLKFSHPVTMPPLVIENATEQFHVIKSDVNSVRIETNFPYDKFLVFNDNYYPGWSAYLNGKPTTLYRANVAFKGIVLAAGHQVVDFRFGETQKYALELSLIVFHALFFFILMRLWVRERNA